MPVACVGVHVCVGVYVYVCVLVGALNQPFKNLARDKPLLVIQLDQWAIDRDFRKSELWYGWLWVWTAGCCFEWQMGSANQSTKRSLQPRHSKHTNTHTYSIYTHTHKCSSTLSISCHASRSPQKCQHETYKREKDFQVLKGHMSWGRITQARRNIKQNTDVWEQTETVGKGTTAWECYRYLKGWIKRCFT